MEVRIEERVKGNTEDVLVGDTIQDFTNEVRGTIVAYKKGALSKEDFLAEMNEMYLEYELMIMTNKKYHFVKMRLLLAINSIMRAFSLSIL